MEKLLTEISGCNTSGTIFSDNENITSPVINFALKKSRKPKTLSDCVQYLSKINDIEQDLTGICFGFENVVLNDELSDKKVRFIAQKLASAIDSNSVDIVRQLKKEFYNDKEFLIAKKFLDKKCKGIWNVFDSKTKILDVPYEAMRVLGITNIPTLDFILGNSVRFYEKDGGSSTAEIINSVLNNKNMPYTILDIHKYLEELARKEKCRFNEKTVYYLITVQMYDSHKLEELKIEKSVINKVYRTMPFFEKVKYTFKYFMKKIKKR